MKKIWKTLLISIPAVTMPLTGLVACSNEQTYSVELATNDKITWINPSNQAKNTQNFCVSVKTIPGYILKKDNIKITVGNEILTNNYLFIEEGNGQYQIVILQNAIKGNICITVTPITSDYINVGDYVDTTGSTPVSSKIQELIDNNPHRTLFFKDGIYLMDHQIATPGDPTKTVDLVLSNFATLKAASNYVAERTGEKKAWQDNYLYMVSLGGKDRVNDIRTPGSNFGMTGGIIDARPVNGNKTHIGGVEIAGGREVKVQNVSMKGVEVGLRIAPGVNSNSSDADVTNLDIDCNQDVNSWGMILDGFDNSVTNSRIGDTVHGVKLVGGGNILRNIHPLVCGGYEDLYDQTVGFEIHSQTYLDYCYADNFRYAFKIESSRAVFNDCFAWWWMTKIGPEEKPVDKTLIYNVGADHKFTSIFNNTSAGFSSIEKHGDQKILQLDYTPTDSEPKCIHNLALAAKNDTDWFDENSPVHKFFTGVIVDY